MTLDEFQRASQATSQWQPGHPDYRGERHRLYGSLGHCGEAGELAEVVKKAIFSGHEFNEAKFLEEGGDAFWYLACVAESHGYTIGDFARTVLEKLARRYPSGSYSNAASIARVDSLPEGAPTASHRVVATVERAGVSTVPGPVEGET
jgi:NTP pyrophosphatase (non-canonical NTP hydrolase)